MALASIFLCYVPALYFEPKIFAYSAASGFVAGGIISIARRFFCPNQSFDLKALAKYTESWVVFKKQGIILNFALL